MPHLGPNVQEVGNQAFRRLADILDLPGSINLSEIDLDVAFATVGLREVIQDAAVTEWLFHLQQVDAGIADNTINARPQFADWTTIIRGNETVTAGVPEDHVAWIVGAGGEVNTVGNLTAVTIQRFNGTVSVRDPFAVWTAAQNGMLLAASGRPHILKPFPWVFAPVNETAFSTQTVRIITSGALTTDLLFRVLSAPPGVFPRLF